MFNRKVLKSRAKKSLAGSYWQILAMNLLITAAGGALSGIIRINLSGPLMLTSPARIVFFSIFMLVSYAVSFLVPILLTQPLSVGMRKSLLSCAEGEQADFSSLLYAFRTNYKGIVFVLLAKELILYAFILVPVLLVIAAAGITNALGLQWCDGVTEMFAALFTGAGNMSNQLNEVVAMCASEPGFIVLMYALYIMLIPFIIKMYDYYLVEYILAEEPDLKWREALKKSKMMMRGNRFRTFVLNLSFLGWLLLGMIVCGIGTIFVMPYMYATDAQLYMELSGKNNIEL